MPARPPPPTSAGSSSSASYAKTLPPPPPSSPLKPSSAHMLGPASPAPTAAVAAGSGPSSRPSTPSRASLFAPVLDDSPLDDRGQRAPVRRRAYFADVVLPSSAASTELSEPVAFLLSTLGDPLSAPPFPPGQDESSNPKLAAAAAAAASSTTPGRMVRAGSVDPSSSESAAGVSTPDPRKLEPLVAELLTTERTYVRRLRALKATYADPLRIFAKDPSMAIIPSYNATALFGNLDVLLAVNEAFLADLERAAAGASGGGPLGVGDVALRHFRDLRAFDCYRHYYDACEDAQAMLSDMVARRRNFAEFVAASKFKTEGIANVGLKELLMEPVQRIPRYTMMWALMVRYMDPLDPQRARLLEASEIARAIAGSEKDEVTRRGMVLMGLGKSVEGFPAELINNNRDYLSSLDVEDTALTAGPSSTADPISPASGHPSASPLNETLILFSDRLLLAKRPSVSSSGRRITGLDDLPRLWKGGVGASSSTGGGPGGKRATTPGGGSGWESDSGHRAVGGEGGSGVKERSIACKGLTTLTDLVAVDLGGPAFSLSIPHALSHAPPSSSSSAPAWTRPHRHLIVCPPPAQPAAASRQPGTSGGGDPRRAKADKQRFLANLWAAQALVRARKGGSRVVIGREEEAFAASGVNHGQAPVGEKGRGYLNVWNRGDWDEDALKAKVVVQIDESGSDAFPGWEADGMRRVQLVFRIQPLAGGLSRVGVRTREVDERNEILPTTAVYAHLLQTIHRLGIYIPRPDYPRSAPPTPTHLGSSVRRPILGLDALSRNLFGSTSSRGGESSLSSGAASHKRTRSAASKASSSAAATDYSSSVTRSTVSSLACSKLSDGVDCDAHARLGHHSREGSGGHPSATTTKSPTTSPHRRQSPGGMKMSRSGSTSPFSTRKPVPIDEEMAEPASTSSGRAGRCDDGEDEKDMDDLGRQLELARKNSESARGSLADHHLRGRQAAASEDEIEPPREVLKRPQTPPLDEAMRRAKSPPVLDDVFGGGLRAKSPGVAERRPHGPRGPTTSRATTPSRASTPIRSATPIGPTAPLRLYPASPVGDRAGLGLGAGPSPSQQPSSAAKKGRSRRVSDEWRNARPSPVAAVPSTTPGPLEETPDSPSSVSSGQKRERRGSVDEPSPVLDKKIRTSDGRSPLSPIRNASTAAQLPPVTGLSIRRSSLPPGSAPAQAPRKVSGAGVTKRIFEAEKAATSAHVEDRILGAARATLEDISDSRRGSKRIKLEVEGLRAHFSRNIGQKDRLQRVGETGSLPRSPPSRNISIRASNRHNEAKEAYETVSSTAAPEDLAPSRPSSSRKAGVDVAFLTDWCAVLEGLIGELDGGLSRAAVNSDRLSADVLGLIEAKRLSAADVAALKTKLAEAKQQIEQAHRLADAQKLELLDAKNENTALYEAFNEELEQMYADMTLPGAEANPAIKRDLQMTKADRNALRLENATLKRELEHAAYEKDRYERILRDRGLL